jgi:peroxiredoxin Q/BCP
VARAYGVVTAERPVPRRWTFYIGTDGRILYIDKLVTPDGHGEEVPERLKELGVLERR